MRRWKRKKIARVMSVRRRTVNIDMSGIWFGFVGGGLRGGFGFERGGDLGEGRRGGWLVLVLVVLFCALVLLFCALVFAVRRGMLGMPGMYIGIAMGIYERRKRGYL